VVIFVLLAFAFLFMATDADAASLASLEGWKELGLQGWILFQRGGIVMYPIFFCSILGVGVSLERLFSLRRGRVIRQDFLNDVRHHWANGDAKEALKVCRSCNISIARVLRAGLQRLGHPLADIERAIDSAGQHEVSLLTTHLRALGFLANVAPMLGFLGTVAGMIQAFNVISQSGTGNPGLVAAGISEALITSAAGLVVGIPSLAAYHYFRSRVDGYVSEMEAISLDLLEGLAKGVSEGGAPGVQSHAVQSP
jgi:biopolymer transport protein ExbB